MDWGPAGPALRALRRFLEGQRWAVYSFLFTILDLVGLLLPFEVFWREYKQVMQNADILA